MGGADVTGLPLAQLRGEVALVTQEHHVFRGTLRDNLTLGQPDAGEQRVRAALAAVEALGWADALPDGLDTVVGSGGAQLTAPQAQQLALARLVLADPHTLVLDEATSLLDPRSARRLERSLSAVLDGRTVIAIAHRLHTAHDADRVIVMEDGAITEAGSHHDLVAADGAYAALWASWHGTPGPDAPTGDAQDPGAQDRKARDPGARGRDARDRRSRGSTPDLGIPVPAPALSTETVDNDVDSAVESPGGQGINGRCPVDD